MATYTPRSHRFASPTEAALFDRFLKIVQARIPTGAQDVVKDRHPMLRISRIQNVKTGRTHDLALLVLIVRETMPNEPIPTEVLDFLNLPEEVHEVRDRLDIRNAHG